MRKITDLVVHTSATRMEWMKANSLHAQMAEIDRWHKARGWFGFGYHFLIGRNGAVLAGRPLEQIGAHVKGHNTNSIGICMVGGHGSAADDAPEEHFTKLQMNALRELLLDLLERFPGSRISGHNQWAAKACPGFNVPIWWKAETVNPFTAFFEAIAAIFAALFGGKK